MNATHSSSAHHSRCTAHGRYAEPAAERRRTAPSATGSRTPDSAAGRTCRPGPRGEGPGQPAGRVRSPGRSWCRTISAGAWRNARADRARQTATVRNATPTSRRVVGPGRSRAGPATLHLAPRSAIAARVKTHIVARTRRLLGSSIEGTPPAPPLRTCCSSTGVTPETPRAAAPRSTSNGSPPNWSARPPRHGAVSPPTGRAGRGDHPHGVRIVRRGGRHTVYLRAALAYLAGAGRPRPTGPPAARPAGRDRGRRATGCRSSSALYVRRR